MLEWYEDEGWFQTSLGKECPDAPTDVGAAVLQKFGVAAWPLSDFVRSNDLTWTLGAIEFAFDNVSEPTDSYWHNWNACGTHVREADVGRGQRDLRRRVNDLLARFEPRTERSGRLRRTASNTSFRSRSVTRSRTVRSLAPSASSGTTQVLTTIDGKPFESSQMSWKNFVTRSAPRFLHKRRRDCSKSRITSVSGITTRIRTTTMTQTSGLSGCSTRSSTPSRCPVESLSEVADAHPSSAPARSMR